jgi:hypothetical protein
MSMTSPCACGVERASAERPAIPDAPVSAVATPREQQRPVSSEDEDLVTALAATAGVAIANARLYEVARVSQDWLSASTTITGRLLSTDPGNPLQLVVDPARDVADADLVAVVLPAADGDGLRVEVAVGSGADNVVGVRIPIAGSLCGRC